MRAAAALALACALACAPGARAQEDAVRWLAEEPAGILPLQDEFEVVVRGVAGVVEVRTHRQQDVRWSCVTHPGAAREIPLAAGLSGRTIVLTAPAGDAARRYVAVSVPARIAVRVETDDALVEGANVESSVSVRGRDLQVRFLNPTGAVDLDLEGGRAILDRPRGESTVRGRPEQAVVATAAGPVSLGTTGGSVEVQASGALVDADVRGTALTLTGPRQPVRVVASEGEVRATDLGAGGDFEMSGAPLFLEGASGEVTIRTDAPVQFKGTKADLHLRGIAASVRGSDHHGLLEIETDSAEVVLSSVDGPLRLRGNSLQVRMEQISETGLITSGSSLELSGVAGPLAIENDFGDVTVRGAEGKVEVKNREGNVTLLGLSGPAVVQTDSEVLTVGWASLPTDLDTESVLVNENGEIRVELPAGGNAYVEAQSRYGTIDSALDWIRVDPDGKSAKGLRGRARAPRLRVVGEGGVSFRGPGGAGGGDP